MPQRIEDLDTPVLLLDGPACDRNLARAAQGTAGSAARLRPHFKNHKCVALAKRQLAAGGCVGVTTAKLGEAEVLVDAGFGDLLVANQVVGAAKVQRLTKANERALVRVAVDSIDNARPIADAAAERGLTIGVLLEVDVGMGRCGVEPGEQIGRAHV